MTEPVVVRIPDPSAAFCRIHGEYLRFTPWPQLAILQFSRALMDRFVADPEVIEMSGGDVTNLTGLLPEFAPLCTRYTKSLLAAWREAGIISTTAECAHCGEEKLGAQAGFMVPDGTSIARHLGFDCCMDTKCIPFKFGEWR